MAAPHVHFSQQEDDGSPPRPVTLTILGCGALGTVILKGILASASHSQGLSEDGSLSATKTAISPLRDPSEPTELRKPTNFIACVRRPESALRVRKALDSSSQLANVQILHGENIRGVNAADIVLLGCKPSMVRDLLQLDGMRVALAGKLLISICAGVSVDQISHSLYGLPYSELFTSNGMTDPCRIVRIMPNIASHIRQSMTLVLNSEPPLPKRHQDMTDWIATRIGQLLHISRSSMDIGTTLCGSGPAFVAFLVDAFADGAVAMGLERSEAYLMIAGTMRGTAELILNGEHPAQIKEKVSTPGGSTIEGLLALENGGTSGIISRSVREATRKASQLGADNSATAAPPQCTNRGQELSDADKLGGIYTLHNSFYEKAIYRNRFFVDAGYSDAIVIDWFVKNVLSLANPISLVICLPHWQNLLTDRLDDHGAGLTDAHFDFPPQSGHI